MLGANLPATVCPLHEPCEDSPTGGAPPYVSALRPGVLVVEGDATVRAALGRRLERSGFCVWLAADWREALDIYESRHETLTLLVVNLQPRWLRGPFPLIQP